MSPKPTTLDKNTHENPTGVERRAAERYRCLRHCMVRLEGAAPGVGNWSGMTYDLSVLGVGVALLYPLAEGTILHIEKFGRQSAPILTAKVVRSSPLAFVWLHGCQLVSLLSEEDLQAWLK